MTNRTNTPQNQLPLFSNTTGRASLGGDGQGDFSGFPESPQSANAESPPLPELADTELSVPEPLRAAGLTHPAIRIPVFSIRLVRERDHLTRQVHSPSDAARLCTELLEDLDREVFLVLALSTSNRIIGAHAAHQGTIDASIASPREAMKFCVLCNARSFLIAHNHPSGNLEPSKADVAVSKQMKAAGEVVGVRLLDSIVCGFDGAYTSLAERGLI